MNIVKLGSAYLNMDLVTDVWIDGGQINVFFAVPTMYSRVPFRGESNSVTTRQVNFYGAEAEALLEWLEKQAEDITPPANADGADATAGADEAQDPVLATDHVDDGPSA